MTAPFAKPFAPNTIEGLVIQLQRRLNEAENRERGTGRKAWRDATIMLAGATVYDNGFPSWRFLNDGRVELRGRLKVATPVANTTPGTKLLRLPGRCAPPGDGANRRSWLSVIGPCATSTTNPGMYRMDVERTLVSEQAVDPDTGAPVFDPVTGLPVMNDVMYADVIARPPGGKTLTDWIGFDHVSFDPQIYTDVLAPVPQADHNKIFSQGYPRPTDGAHVSQPIPGEFGITILSYDGGGRVAVIPGMENPNTTPPP